MIKILKGNIVFTKEKDSFEVYEQSYIIIDDSTVKGIYRTLPETFDEIEVKDYGEAIIVPSFIDLHIHGPQFSQRGIGMNLQLIDWLNQYTFLLEGKFADVNYGKKMYPDFVDSLYDHGTLRSVIFATVHDESNRCLIELLKDKGLSAYVGKVNMDRNAPVSLIQTSERSLRETEAFIDDYSNETLVKPIITPRFAPSCSQGLLEGLGRLSIKYHVPVQSHLSENRDEVAWVKSLFPDNDSYSHVYHQNLLLGQEKTLMAHAIYLEDKEIPLLVKENVFLVHCPYSNMNLASGIMPLTNYMDRGLNIGLGSDVGGGNEIAMYKTIAAAIQCSKMRYVNNSEERILSESEGFYLATKVNGKFFGDDIGSFEEGYKFDALVIRDDNPLLMTLSPLEQLERFIYCGETKHIIARYLEGNQI